MKKIINITPFVLALLFFACNSNTESAKTASSEANITAGGQEAVIDDISQKDVVKIAVGSKDHTTLVAALQQANYVDDLSNVGPFTVFAPTNEAFSKLPAGTVEELIKPENKEKLAAILTYHVVAGKALSSDLSDGQLIKTVNGQEVTISIGDHIKVDGAVVITADLEASNGVIHVIDSVIMPK